MELRKLIEDVADREVRPTDELQAHYAPQQENVMRSLVEESPSFRSELLALRLATLPVLCSLAGNFSTGVEKACRDTCALVTNDYFLGVYKLIMYGLGWGKGCHPGPGGTWQDHADCQVRPRRLLRRSF